MSTVIVRASGDALVSVAQAPDRHLVRAHAPQRQVVLAGVRGRPGKDGQPGESGADTVLRLAGATISARHFVYEQDGLVYQADYRLDRVHQLIGMALTAADPGHDVMIRRAGVVDDVGWGLSLGPAWLGGDGAVTQVPPSDGYSVVVGAALSATRFQVAMQPPILLEV